MNALLEKKFNEIDSVSDYVCWYIVRQETSFVHLCYLVSFLKKFKEENPSDNLETYIKKNVEIFNKNHSFKITDTYRALRVAFFYGLIRNNGSLYKDAIITSVYYEIENRCNHCFENTDTYQDIIDRQIEKIHMTSSIDDQYQGSRKNFDIYPIPFLYKILLELGKTTGDYSISLTELRAFVATCKNYNEFLDAVINIKLYNSSDASDKQKFEVLCHKFDNRFNKVLEHLSTIDVKNGRYTLNESKIDEVLEKVYLFEKGQYSKFDNSNYLDFLCSDKSLFINEKNIDSEDNLNEKYQFNFDEIKGNGSNIIVYGTPGCGKSFYVENSMLKNYDFENNVIRTTFYQDYSSTDFIGQILPMVKPDKTVTYEFIPGPFAIALNKAVSKPNENIALVIEELNRGNAASIFGDIFQLLDRNENGISEYKILNVNLQRYLELKNPTYKFDSIKLPGNFNIIATMNTSDQNVFTLDTAFKRRWEFIKINNKFSDNHPYKNYYIPGMEKDWETFCTSINKTILKDQDGFNSEDKQIGVFFIDKNGLRINRDIRSTEDERKKFAFKIFEYLWDDVAKYSRDTWFQNVNSLDELIEKYVEYGKNEIDGIKVFGKGIFD